MTSPSPTPPELWRDLTAAVDLSPAHLAAVEGPRWWWAGQLDVEGLVLGSAQAAATALARLTGRVFGLTSSRVAASFGSLGYLRIAGERPAGFAPLSGFQRTADGWVRLHANYPHHAKALYTAMRADNADQLRRGLLDCRAVEVEDRIHDAGGVAAAVRTMRQWNDTEMGAVAASGSWITFVGGRDAPANSKWQPPSVRYEPPLQGLRVLDLTRVIAGPSASRLLGALGADVLRVDPPAHPELWDHHIDTGFCKRSIELDLGTTHGRQTMTDLLDGAHLLLLGYRNGSLSKFGLDSAEVRRKRPALRVVALDAWGTRGPWASRRGFDSLVQAASGVADAYRDEQGRPGSLPVQALDHATGMGMVAASAALLTADQVGGGVARLSLARTAHELTRCPPPGRVAATKLDVPKRHMQSPYGPLEYVPPPLTVDGSGTEYHRAPVLYGGSQAGWPG